MLRAAGKVFSSCVNTRVDNDVYSAKEPGGSAEKIKKGKAWYQDNWHKWEKESVPGAGEQRDMALKKLMYALEKKTATLDLSGLGLTSLPELPSFIKELSVKGNALTQLPNLPPRLKYLNVKNNHLHTLPDELPATLNKINCKKNPLGELQPWISCLSKEAEVYIPGGFLSRQSVELLEFYRDHISQGPKIFYSNPADAAAEFSPVSLQKNAAIWFPADDKNEIKKKFSAVAHENGANAFSNFLTQLADSTSARNNPQFRAHVAEWLIRLLHEPELREATFFIAIGASASCEDRTTLTWNMMQNAALINRINQGEYDSKLKELVKAGREIFRLEQLERLAAEYSKVKPDADEIGIYLGLQTKLRERLRLTITAPEMMYFPGSAISYGLLEDTEMKVKKAENYEFLPWFAQWEPWQKTLERIAPERWQQVMAKRVHMLENDFQDRLDAALETAGLIGDADGERNVGPQILKDINAEVFEHLTIETMDKSNQMALNTPWPTIW